MWSSAADGFSPSVVCARAQVSEGDGVILIVGTFFRRTIAIGKGFTRQKGALV